MRDMRDMGADRSRRASVREERLRATAGLREASALTSWRGLSGRRYVADVHALGEAEITQLTDAVLIAVERTSDGTAKVLDVAAPGAQTPLRARSGWLSRMRARGATEMHVHRLAMSDEERRAVVADLLDQAS
jgi:hypothetical protein